MVTENHREKELHREKAKHAVVLKTSVALCEYQLKELDNAVKEADNKDTIDWSDFKKEMGEWKKG